MSDLQAKNDEVRIRLKHRDWEVEITCIQDKVKQVVENVLSGIDTSSSYKEDQDSNVTDQLNLLKNEIEAIKLQIELYPGNPAESNSSSSLSIDESQRRHVLKGGVTCRGLLESLWYEGYFASEKPLAVVHEELSRRGYNYDRTAVSHSLTDMVRESSL